MILRPFLFLLLILSFLYQSMGCVQMATKSSDDIYSGPLIDAVTQWDRNGGDLDKLLSTARAVGVTKIVIGHRRPFSTATAEDQFYKTLTQYDSFVVPASPKFFPGEVRRSVVDHLIGSIHQYKYAFVSEAMFRHADKRLGKVTKNGEVSIDPLSSDSRYLLDRLSKENIPLFIHWEFYLWDLDYPKFSALFSLYPKQKFIISHMGFGSPEQMEMLLRKHPNIFATISKRDSRFEYFLDDSTFQGSSLLDEAGKLRKEWLILFCRYPDRFLFATDAHKDYMWNAYKEIIARYRIILGQLPHQVAELIAYQNAKQLFGI